MATSKKQQILDNALTLFSQNGIHATSTSSIVKAAGVATGTLFHHFSNKEELITELYLSVKKELAQQAVQTTEQVTTLQEKAECFWNNALDWAINNPQKLQFCQQISTLQILSHQNRLQVFRQELSFLIDLIETGQQQGVLALYPIELMAENCEGLFFSTSRYFIENEKMSNNQQHRDAAFNMFWHALTK